LSLPRKRRHAEEKEGRADSSWTKGLRQAGGLSSNKLSMLRVQIGLRKRKHREGQINFGNSLGRSREERTNAHRRKKDRRKRIAASEATASCGLPRFCARAGHRLRGRSQWGGGFWVGWVCRLVWGGVGGGLVFWGWGGGGWVLCFFLFVGSTKSGVECLLRIVLLAMHVS